jgi:serpin B
MTIQYQLKKPLVKMGMKTAFTGSADFSGMCESESLFIDQVYHKAFVKVDEEGTEAAAATAVVMSRKSAVRPQPVLTFHADHPFIYLIRDNQTGSILFMGRLTDPR